MNTLLALLATHGPQVELAKVCELFGLSVEEAAKRAARQALPVPCYRIGSQKSPWIVDAPALADYLNSQRAKARKEWSAINGDAA
jgi:hypothetical protein